VPPVDSLLTPCDVAEVVQGAPDRRLWNQHCLIARSARRGSRGWIETTVRGDQSSRRALEATIAVMVLRPMPETSAIWRIDAPA
jgi:hypothetical protein